MNTKLASPLVAVILVGAAAACSDPASSSATASSVSCTNYAVHGTGKYHDEVWVQVSVSNTTTNPVNYTVNVNLAAADQAGSADPAMQVAITGLVAAKTAAELSRKVLSVSQVNHCQITHLSQS
jgi:hypothetical protein